jgi:ssDNA-binding Zn-finger/Zn-ribbon topoisomerase 1
VTDLLVEWFPKIMNPKFTSHFEEELDDIETGKCHYAEVLDEFWGPFSEALHKAQAEMPAQHGIPTGEKCPECGRDLLHLFSQKTGRQFVGCSGFKDDPACRYIKPGEGEEARPQPQVTDIPCPACGKFMVRKEGRFGTFFTCQGAPDCPTTMNLGPDGQPIVDVVQDLPASERFFAGGDTTVRGFSLDRLGVDATISPTGFPTGGNGLVVLNGELRATLIGSFGAVAFIDSGNVFLRATDLDLTRLRAAAGVGIRYQSPVGPIRIDMGFKLDRRELAPGRLERRSVLHISLGQAF